MVLTYRDLEWSGNDLYCSLNKVEFAIDRRIATLQIGFILHQKLKHHLGLLKVFCLLQIWSRKSEIRILTLKNFSFWSSISFLRRKRWKIISGHITSNKKFNFWYFHLFPLFWKKREERFKIEFWDHKSSKIRIVWSIRPWI